jgi:hypothetical protein
VEGKVKFREELIMNRSLGVFLGLLFVAVAASAQLPVDYSVYFDPQPAVANGVQAPVTPIRTTGIGKVIERVYGIIYDVGQTPGTHTYKYVLKAQAPNSTTYACQASAIVQPFGPRDARRRIAYFEAVYPMERLAPFPKQPPSKYAGRYSLWVYAEEQVPSGQTAQDTSTGNNSYPDPNGGCCKLLMDVRPNVEAIHCGIIDLKVLKP